MGIMVNLQMIHEVGFADKALNGNGIQNLGVVRRWNDWYTFTSYHAMFLISDVASWIFFLKDLKLVWPLLVQ
jgi:hypothetical protein